MTENGNVGSLATVRVNYDDVDPDVKTIKTYRDNTCHGCVDYSLGGGLCNRECEGRGFGVTCDYGTQPIREACHLRAPGNEVVVNGTRIECCNTPLGPKYPAPEPQVSCELDHLVRKEITLEWKGKPIKMVVSVCGE